MINSHSPACNHVGGAKKEKMFHNKLIETIKPDTAERVAFNTLRTGDKFRHTNNVDTVFKRDDDSITVKRYDGWYVTINKDDYGWDKMVVKI